MECSVKNQNWKRAGTRGLIIFGIALAIIFWGMFEAATANPMMNLKKKEDTPSAPLIVIKDADTFKAGRDENIRLKGWDGPEAGFRAKCKGEHELHVLAKAYGQELVDNADDVAVITLPGERCGWNRYCGDLLLDNKRYSELMAAAGYLKPWDYDSGEDKPNWCG